MQSPARPVARGPRRGREGPWSWAAAPTVLEDYDVVHASADSTFSMRDAKCEGVRDPGWSVDKGWQARRSTGSVRGRSAGRPRGQRQGFWLISARHIASRATMPYAICERAAQTMLSTNEAHGAPLFQSGIEKHRPWRDRPGQVAGHCRQGPAELRFFERRCSCKTHRLIHTPRGRGRGRGRGNKGTREQGKEGRRGQGRRHSLTIDLTHYTELNTGCARREARLATRDDRGARRRERVQECRSSDGRWARAHSRNSGDGARQKGKEKKSEGGDLRGDRS